jgi:hypothetical protein|tara:strand:- start:645 stop:785 length:141 start_codon:yes stop_codon:yes gene_type:complete
MNEEKLDEILEWFKDVGVECFADNDGSLHVNEDAVGLDGFNVQMEV